MKKIALYTGLVFVLVSFLTLPGQAASHLVGGVQIGYGVADYKVLGEELSQSNQWSTGLWANLTYEDLLFTTLYQRTNGLGEPKVETDLIQLGANYRFYEEDILRIYSGIGYQLINTQFEHDQVNDGIPFSITGKGFIGQVLVDIDITQHIKAMAGIAGSPWQTWSFTQSKVSDSNIDKAPSFTYHLDLFITLPADFGLRLGLDGGNYKVPAFDNKEETRHSNTEISVGLTRIF